MGHENPLKGYFIMPTEKSQTKKDQNEGISHSFSICMCVSVCASFTILLIDIAFNPI